MNSRLLASASSLSLAMATAGYAADLPVKAPPAIVAPAWNWSGAYVGLSIGAGKNRTGFFDLGDLNSPTRQPLTFPPGEFYAARDWGVTIGGQAGYNWQFNHVVVGIEADINWLDGK